MDNLKPHVAQSMNDIVFENRNKTYGAYALRETYQKHIVKAMVISISIFVFSLYSPKIARKIGLFSDKPAETFDTTTIVLSDVPPLKPDEPAPPPPPPVQEVIRPTERFLELLAVKKEEAIEPPPPTIDELENKDIGTKKVEGEVTNDPPPIIDEVGGGDVVDEKIYVDVDQSAEFIGGEAALADFLRANLEYPESARLYEVSGETEVNFVVNTDGKVIDVKVGRSSGNADLDAEALRVVRKCSYKFRPGKFKGKPVRTFCRIPITFELEGD
jgi:periplasmic protein TonB